MCFIVRHMHLRFKHVKRAAKRVTFETKVHFPDKGKTYQQPLILT